MLTNYIRNTSSCDSHLYIDDIDLKNNARFILIFRVYLQQGAVGAGLAHDHGWVAGAADAAKHTWDSLAFTDKDWNKLTSTFKTDAEKFWSDKFALVPQIRYPELTFPSPIPPSGSVSWVPPPAKVQCNVNCEIKIDLRSSGADAHHTIVIYNIGKSKRFFRANSATYNQKDVTETSPGYDKEGRMYKQRTLYHEFGHIMGLAHVGVTTNQMYKDKAGNTHFCAIDDDFENCYTGPTSKDTNNTMGMGNALTAREASPWLNRITAHTGLNPSQWAVRMPASQSPPKKL
jgi:hypothetical protein